jgi:hypothetical protein
MPFRAPRISFRRSAADVWLGHATTWLGRGVALVAFTSAAGICVWVAWSWSQRHRVLAEQRERVMSTQAEYAARKPPAKVHRAELNAAEAEQYNLAISELNTPWSDIFNGLEREAQADVALTVVEPDTKKGTLDIQAEAKDVGRLLIYAQLLGSDKAFGTLSLQRHETNEQDPNRPARLSFEVRFADAFRMNGAWN